jgi:hypothetical protein
MRVTSDLPLFSIQTAYTSSYAEQPMAEEGPRPDDWTRTDVSGTNRAFPPSDTQPAVLAVLCEMPVS